ncbi:MAG TPA: efflux RND transporter periplasmic adaptor subunit [Methylomirabilota bacterium]|nr:efflux RND transporter periplasmic adaptor subunit [Methylomirabilota bacterium]
MKRLAALLLSLLVIGGVSFLVYRNNDWAGAQPAAGASAPPAVRVQVAAAVQKPFPVEIGTIGTVTALATVAIKSRVDGQIMDAYIKDGQDVKAGDLLFSIDSRTIAAQLIQAEANLARDQALLASAKHDVERQTALVSKNFASKQLLDQTNANADSLAASVRADQAAVDAANVQLSYTEIRAPIDGRAGVVNLPRGNMVKANDTSALVVLNQLRPIYVAFAVPQNDLPHIREAMASSTLAASVTIPGDERGALTGKLTFVDNAVDTTTGTIQLRATFDNDDTRLWPGQFVNVALTLRTDPSAIVVPDAAVEHGQSGTYVFVVGKDSTVEMRPVAIGRSLRGETVVESGLAAGEQVVVEGQLRLAPGTRVEPRPAGQLPSADTTS